MSTTLSVPVSVSSFWIWLLVRQPVFAFWRRAGIVIMTGLLPELFELKLVAAPEMYPGAVKLEVGKVL